MTARSLEESFSHAGSSMRIGSLSVSGGAALFAAILGVLVTVAFQEARGAGLDAIPSQDAELQAGSDWNVELGMRPRTRMRSGTSDLGAPDGSGLSPTSRLLAEIATWLSANFGLPSTDELPRVEFASAMRLMSIRLGGLTAAPRTTAEAPRPPLAIGDAPVAVYDNAKRIIYLPEGWSDGSHAETSILVHEMVHHLQNVGRVAYPCPDAREKPAYLAQDAWLRRFGDSLEASFEVDLFTVVARSACL